MSEDTISGKIRRNFSVILRSVGMACAPGHRSLYEGNGVRIVLRCRTKPDKRDIEGSFLQYSFGLTDRYHRLLKSASAEHTNDIVCKDYILLMCGDNGKDMPVALYLLPADFITSDSIKKYQDKTMTTNFI